MPEYPLQTEFVEANGLRMEVLTCGQGDRLALCLHGFPELATSWREQMPVLAELGYRVWAPNQRGYGQTTRPSAVADYSIETLMQDVAALIDASGATDVTLIAHDWGALVAWNFAARRLRPLQRMVIANVPHPACFARALRRPGQMLRSWYVGFFQLPGVPEWALSRNGGAAVRKMMLRTSTSPDAFPHDLLDACAAHAAQPGAARAMVNWYRAFLRGGGLRRQLRQGFPPIDIPVLQIWGMRDTYLAYYTTDGTERYAPLLQRRELPGVSHWVQQDATRECNRLLREFLDRNGAARITGELPIGQHDTSSM
ncbi:MAG: alpha/beta fold hydrolase [Janthinobacterium lividum]